MTSEKTDIEDGASPVPEGAKVPISRLADPLEPREGRDLVWRNVSMRLTSEEGKELKILDNVFGEVPRGQGIVVASFPAQLFHLGFCLTRPLVVAYHSDRHHGTLR